ncbi:MAG TPA: HlyD family efflux transporter periplasmic adaptor subunit [bacterium]|nr:HlyD family efflux transporter periplasmic adaptor subunit [bacterium]
MDTDRYKAFKRTLLIAAGVGVAAAALWALRPRPLPVELGRVARGPYELTVVEDGVTRAKEIFTVAADVSGNLKRVTRHAGDRVKAGEAVAEIEWDEPRFLRSPVDGFILRVVRESAGPIERGQTVIEIADAMSLEIVADVLTTDAVRIRPGASVKIEGWGGPRPLEGKVRIVEPSAFEKTSALGVEEQRVNVVIDFVSPPEEWKGLGDKYRVVCHIVVASLADALTVPTGALFREDDSWAVFAVEGGRARKRLVGIESRNPVQAVVASGLTAGETVILYPGDRIRDGTRVRPLK